MVDILIHHYRRTIGRLNPYVLPHVPQYQVDINKMDEKMKENNIRSLLSKDCQGKDLMTTKLEKMKLSK